MGDRADRAANSMERIAVNNRTAVPCGGFQAVSKFIQICECGWDEEAHTARLHAFALEEDEERNA